MLSKMIRDQMLINQMLLLHCFYQLFLENDLDPIARQKLLTRLDDAFKVSEDILKLSKERAA